MTFKERMLYMPLEVTLIIAAGLLTDVFDVSRAVLIPIGYFVGSVTKGYMEKSWRKKA